MGIDGSAQASHSFMSSEWPWRFAWESFENQVKDIQLERAKQKNRQLLRKETITEDMKAQPWVSGEDFETDWQSKQVCYRARKSVLEEIELRSGKSLRKVCLMPVGTR